MLLRVDAIRAIRGYGKQDLARRSDLTPSTISAIMNGRRSPTSEELRVLSKVLRVPQKHLAGVVELGDVIPT